MLGAAQCIAREGVSSANEAMSGRGGGEGEPSFLATHEGTDADFTNDSVVGWSDDDSSTDSRYSRLASDPTTGTTEDVVEGGLECCHAGDTATAVVGATQEPVDDPLEYVWSGDGTLGHDDEPLMDVQDDGVRCGAWINAAGDHH